MDEDQYEKFIYSNQEYLEILKIRKKSKQSLNSILEKKACKLNDVKSEISIIDKSIKDLSNYIIDLGKDISSDYNSAYVRKIDDRIKIVKEEISKIEFAKGLAEKKEDMVRIISKISTDLDILKLKVEAKQNKAQKDMLIKKKKFNEIYNSLMKNSYRNCYEAYIGEDYMPYTNNVKYRARNASVSKRLMYFLTLLILGVQYDINYPRFLMVDTPNKEGIDAENLIKLLNELSKVYEYRKNQEIDFQIILTTGINVYPKEFKKHVFLTLQGEDRLLKERSIK